MTDRDQTASREQCRFFYDLCNELEIDVLEALDEFADGADTFEELNILQASHVLSELKAMRR